MINIVPNCRNSESIRLGHISFCIQHSFKNTKLFQRKGEIAREKDRTEKDNRKVGEEKKRRKGIKQREKESEKEKERESEEEMHKRDKNVFSLRNQTTKTDEIAQ